MREDGARLKIGREDALEAFWKMGFSLLYVGATV